MTMATGQDFELRVGNYHELVVYITRIDGSVMQLPSYTAEWRFFRPNAHNPFLTKNSSANPDISITDIEAGEVTVKLRKNDTVDLKDGLYYHELVIIDPQGNEVSTTSGHGYLYTKKE
jgi:hypothetical protein